MGNFGLPLKIKTLKDFTSYMLYRWNDKYYVKKVRIFRKNWIEIGVENLTSNHQISKEVYRYLEIKDCILRLHANDE